MIYFSELGKGDAGSISSELLMCDCVRSILLLPLVARCLATIYVLVLSGLCLTLVVTPSIKISLPNREGPTLIHKAYRQDTYYVL